MSKNNLVEVNEDSIKKAYEILGIKEEEISKAEGGDDNEEEEGEEMEKKKKSLEKSIKDNQLSIEKAQEELELLNGKKPEEDNTEKLSKSITDSLNKSFGEKFDAVVTLNKSLVEQVNSLTGQLEKSEERIASLEEEPAQRKSITTQSFIEKAFQEDGETGKKMLSVSKHKPEIQKLLIQKSGFDRDVIEKSEVDNFWTGEMQYFEATGTLHPKGIERLFKEDGIQLVG